MVMILTWCLKHGSYSPDSVDWTDSFSGAKNKGQLYISLQSWKSSYCGTTLVPSSLFRQKWIHSRYDLYYFSHKWGAVVSHSRQESNPKYFWSSPRKSFYLWTYFKEDSNFPWMCSKPWTGGFKKSRMKKMQLSKCFPLAAWKLQNTGVRSTGTFHTETDWRASPQVTLLGLCRVTQLTHGEFAFG